MIRPTLETLLFWSRVDAFRLAALAGGWTQTAAAAQAVLDEARLAMVAAC